MPSKNITAVSLFTLAFISSISHAEPETPKNIRASAGVASMHLHRGLDFSEGSPHVFGDLSYISAEGFYGSIWGSSGSETSEFDIFMGWTTNIQDVTINTGLVSYTYPGSAFASGIGSEIELFFTLKYANAELSFYDNVNSKGLPNEDYFYVSGSYRYEDFTALLGHASDSSIGDGGSFNYSHLDVRYSYNDRLSFALSQKLDQNAKLGGRSVAEGKMRDLALSNLFYRPIKDDSMQFQVQYILPI